MASAYSTNAQQLSESVPLGIGADLVLTIVKQAWVSDIRIVHTKIVSAKVHLSGVILFVICKTPKQPSLVSGWSSNCSSRSPCIWRWKRSHRRIRQHAAKEEIIINPKGCQNAVCKRIQKEEIKEYLAHTKHLSYGKHHRIVGTTREESPQR